MRISFLATARSDVLVISSHNGQLTGGYTDRQSVSRPELKKKAIAGHKETV